MTSATTAAISTLNDQFRREVPARVPGMRVATAGIAASPQLFRPLLGARSPRSIPSPPTTTLWRARFRSARCCRRGHALWKTDYYATAQLDAGAEDPPDPSASFRVLP